MSRLLAEGDIPPNTPEMRTVTFPREYLERWRRKAMERGQRNSRRIVLIETLRFVLQAVEWGSYRGVIGADGQHKMEVACPYCSATSSHGHYPYCLLGKALKVSVDR